MKKVILVRHGKSSWDNPDLDDHDRPLNPRGRGAVPVISQWLASRGHRPDLVLCSSSQRTRETASLLNATFPEAPQPVYEENLYHAPPKAMLAHLRAIGPNIESVMIIGHNPGLSALTRKLAGGTIRPRCARAFTHFPTAAAAVFTAEVEDWGDLAYGQATFIDFARPRELAAAQ